MDLLDSILSSRRRRGGNNDFFETLRGAWRWILGCGCALVVAIAVVAVLIVEGTIQLGDNALTVGVVLVMIVVSIVSLIRVGRT